MYLTIVITLSISIGYCFYVISGFLREERKFRAIKKKGELHWKIKD